MCLSLCMRVFVRMVACARLMRVFRVCTQYNNYRLTVPITSRRTLVFIQVHDELPHGRIVNREGETALVTCC